MQPLRRNTPNYKRGKKNRAEEGCETKGQENVTLNKAYEHHGEPERRKPEPQVNREKSILRLAGQKEPSRYRLRPRRRA
jgi:hypothetical protein